MSSTSHESADLGADRVRLLSLPQIPDSRGNLTALEELVELPFRIGSARWFYDVPAGASWSAGEPGLGHAVVIALSGSFDVVVDQPAGPARLRLSRASTAVVLPAGARWRADDLATNSVGLVISSQPPRRPVGRRNVPLVDTTVDDCSTASLGRRRGREGSTTDVVSQRDVPFELMRVYYLYDVPGGASRGGHAHLQLEQVLIAAAGSFEVVLDDGRRVKTVRLDRPEFGICISSGIWRELQNFSSGAICLALASAPYEEADYIRDYGEFRRMKGA
jgi:hypothetical protein